MGLVFKRRIFSGLATITLLSFSMGSKHAVAQAVVGAPVDTRAAAVNRILADYRDDQTKLEPEAASLAGDKRYNDQLSDFSASAANAKLARGQTFIQRLSEVDTAGLPDKTRQAADGLLNRLIDEQSSDRTRMWQRPLEQFTGLQKQFLSIAETLPFQNTKDYDDYVSRLKKIPNALSQIMTNIQLGAETARVLPQQSVDNVLVQVQEISAQPAGTSILMTPFKRFPATIAAEDRKRLTESALETISSDVIPSYQRFGRFVASHAAQKPSTPTP